MYFLKQQWKHILRRHNRHPIQGIVKTIKKLKQTSRLDSHFTLFRLVEAQL